VPDPDQADDAGRPVAAAEEEAAMRRQIERTLRFMRLQTTIGIVVILALIIFASSIRGVMILVLIIFSLSSLGAYWWLRRNLNSRLKGPGAGAS
jgi:predicted RND superfamily exporter protein